MPLSDQSQPVSEAQPFRVDLRIQHPDGDPSESSKALGLTPWLIQRKGNLVANVQAKKFSWLCHFAEGAGNDQLNRTLEAVLKLITEHITFFESLSKDEGTAEVTLSADVPIDDGIIYDLSLEPSFLQGLARANVHLRLTVWTRPEAQENQQ